MSVTSTAPAASRSTAAPKAPSRGLIPLALSVTLAMLLFGAAAYGLFAGNAYRVPAEQVAIGQGQDLLTLALAPLLVWAAVRARAGSVQAHLLWLGLLLFIVYAYLNVAFGMPFNDMFLGYAAIIGISSYALLSGLLRTDVAAVAAALDRAPYRSTAWVLLVSGTAFALLWLGDILPAIPGGTPSTMVGSDLAKTTEALDLAWLIPLSTATAVLLLRRHAAGPALAVVLVTKLLILSVDMLVVAAVVLARGEPIGTSAAVQSAIFVALAGVLGTLLWKWFRHVRPVAHGWLHRSLWRTAAGAQGLPASKSNR